MEIGKIVRGAGIEPTCLALIGIPPRLPDVSIIPTPACLWGFWPPRSVHYTI